MAEQRRVGVMIERMFDDTLWIYTAIAGTRFGAAFLAYFKDT